MMMAGLTPAECYTAMQGADGIGKGLTTYADHPDPDTAETHANCLALEGAGGCTRYWEGVTDVPDVPEAKSIPFVMWMPVPDVTPPDPPIRSAAPDEPPSEEPMAATPFFDVDEPEKKPA
jgi:hypothetical protein